MVGRPRQNTMTEVLGLGQAIRLLKFERLPQQHIVGLCVRRHWLQWFCLQRFCVRLFGRRGGSVLQMFGPGGRQSGFHHASL